MSSLSERINNHVHLSNSLACISSKELKRILASGKPLHNGIGGSSVKIDIEGCPVFVKKIPLTKHELEADNYQSTANIFNLPSCYQYGVGSSGFGAWRELGAHIMTTNWVIAQQCQHFPIMYHWRIQQDNPKKGLSYAEKKCLEKEIIYWENNSEINQRIRAHLLATHYIYLFIEFIPSHLSQWLNRILKGNENETIKTIKSVDQQIQDINIYMQTQGFLHMDAHFENILTDGDTIYYSDFGLALSNKFDLTNQEILFMQNNASYDYANASCNLIHCILANLLGNEITFRDYHDKKTASLTKSFDSLIQKHLAIALLMGDFYSSVQKDKSTSYPGDKIEALLEKRNEPPYE